MTMLDEKMRRQLTQAFAAITQALELVVFTSSKLILPGRDAPGQQEETLALLRELAKLSDKLDIVERPLAGDDEAAALGIERAPTLLIREAGTSRSNIRFLGLPSGYEFATLVQAVLMLGTGNSGLSERSRAQLAAIATPVHLQTFVTPTCPYCPQAVLTGYRLAFHNPSILAEGIEANEFPSLSQYYRISSVPDTVIHGHASERILGAQPERIFVEAILKASASPTAPGT
jgi:glutaredoxin-like protein